jgi:spore maturation protein CgeB
MRIVMFYHSLVSDWNHGNAHFLRGVASELVARGHDVRVYEPIDGWSFTNLRAEQGERALDAFVAHYPLLESHFYDPRRAQLEPMLAGADLVLVHEWNPPDLIARIGAHRARHHYVLLFHDTHHRSVSDAAGLARCNLTHYDGVLAYGEAIRQRYLAAGWTRRAWTWHEAADTRVFKPLDDEPPRGDLVWIGNWGDGERDAELREFLVKPAAHLKLRGTIYGVRYPRPLIRRLKCAGLAYKGWLANFDAPRAYAGHRVTVHIPRRPYARELPGIPTIRVFEALASGIPLVCAPWDDCEGLFTPGEDYLVARDGAEMQHHLRAVLAHPEYAATLAARGRRTILARHTCAHRVDEMLALTHSLTARRAEPA